MVCLNLQTGLVNEKGSEEAMSQFGMAEMFTPFGILVMQIALHEDTVIEIAWNSFYIFQNPHRFPVRILLTSNILSTGYGSKSGPSIGTQCSRNFANMRGPIRGTSTLRSADFRVAVTSNISMAARVCLWGEVVKTYRRDREKTTRNGLGSLRQWVGLPFCVGWSPLLW
mgnify:CR=1 FL=1